MPTSKSRFRGLHRRPTMNLAAIKLERAHREIRRLQEVADDQQGKIQSLEQENQRLQKLLKEYNIED